MSSLGFRASLNALSRLRQLTFAAFQLRTTVQRQAPKDQRPGAENQRPAARSDLLTLLTVALKPLNGENLFSDFPAPNQTWDGSSSVAIGSTFDVRTLLLFPGHPARDRARRMAEIGRRGAFYVAVKLPVISPDRNLKFPTPDGARSLEKVIKEVRILTHPRLCNHPFIVKLLGLSWEANLHSDAVLWPAMVQEWADSGTLTEFARREPPLPTSRKEEFVGQVASALQALHPCGVVHGDLKCDNILVISRGRGRFVAKLCDFGASIFIGNNHVRASARGTWPFEAPEASSGALLDRNHLISTDCFSFGMLVWQLFIDGETPPRTSDTK